MDVELPEYNDIFNDNLRYFENPQYRFNTFYNCNLALNFSIQDYVKSGFLFKGSNSIICYKCKLEKELSRHIDPCLLHKKYRSLCIYSSKIEIHHTDTNLSHELTLITLLICIVLVICLIVAAVHIGKNCY